MNWIKKLILNLSFVKKEIDKIGNEKNVKIFLLEEQIKNTIIIPGKCYQKKKSKKPKSKRRKVKL